MPAQILPRLFWAVMLIGLAGRPSPGQEVTEPEELLIGPVPKIVIDEKRFSTSPDERAEIEKLIDALAQTDKPDYGLMPLGGNWQFAPLEDSRTYRFAGGGVMMRGKSTWTSAELTELVQRGPRALPQLLEHLSDARETKLVLPQTKIIEAMYFRRDVSVNRANPRELAAAEKNGVLQDSQHGFNTSGPYVDTYTVTIGDVCLVIIGQIVNRPYLAVRYQPSGWSRIYSPTHDPVLAAAVREMWSSTTPAQSLLESLLIDLYSKDAGRLSYTAAMRLLYFFPDETSDLIARRLSEVELPQAVDAQGRQEIDLSPFVHSVRFSSQPPILDALWRIIREADDRELFSEAVMSEATIRDPDFVIRRMEQFLKIPAEQSYPISEVREILAAAQQHLPMRASALFTQMRQDERVDAQDAVLQALRDVSVPRRWMVPFLSDYLNDQRVTEYRYGSDRPPQHARVCDLAALVLAGRFLQDAPVGLEQNSEHMDRQIAKIKRVLAGDRNVDFGKEKPALLPEYPP